MKWCALFLLPFLLAFETPLEDPAEEARAQALMLEIRCVACENEPISQSSADIAADMRVRIREMVEDGASNAEIRAWFADRYGEFVLFRPSASGVSGFVLWGFPFALLVMACCGIALMRRFKSDNNTPVAVPVGAHDHDKENEI